MNESTSSSDERQFKDLFDPATILCEEIDEIYVIDAHDGRYLYANELALTNTGYTLDEFRLMTPLDLQKGTDFEILTKRIEPLRQGEQHVVIFETDYCRKDGSSYLVEHRVQLLSSHDPPVFVVRAHEISERRLPAQSLVDDPDMYRRLVEEADEGIWVIDADNNTTYANEAIVGMLGYTCKEMLGASLFHFMDNEGKAIATANLERRREGVHQRLEFKYVRKDGSDLWTLIAVHPLLDSRGTYTGAYAIVTDISERKLRDRALLNTLHVETPEELWGVALPSSGKPVVRMPPVLGPQAALVAKRFSILADPKRLELIELLASGEERTVTALAESLDMTQSNVSKHLKVLAEAALVNRRQDGTKTFYALADPTVAILCRIVCQWLGDETRAESPALAG